MADFIPTTACSSPRLKHHEAVQAILDRYYTDPELSIGVGFDRDNGEPYFFCHGFAWPEAWRVPAGTAPADFDPYTEELYEEGDEGFVQLLLEIAPYLAEPLVVQAIGSIKCRFPLSACEWHVLPGGTDVQINQFRAGEAIAVAL